MTFGSLFAGIGGMDLGLERAGLVCKWQVEINEYARRILAKHWPHVPKWDDVRTFPPAEGDWTVDLIAGGFPCKQTSTGAAIHGRRVGLEGADSGLWYEMLRVVSLLRPKWVVVENVGGAKRWAAEIKRGLADAGYRVPDRPIEMSAACFGAPHRRRRLFWIADVDGKGLEIARQGGPSPTESVSRRTSAGNPWLENIAGVWRMDDGSAYRVDRIERCGNAVMPVMSEWIGRRLMDVQRPASADQGEGA